MKVIYFLLEVDILNFVYKNDLGTLRGSDMVIGIHNTILLLNMIIFIYLLA